MTLEVRQATEKDFQFARELHHVATREVVIAQFGEWDEKIQDEFFLKSWNPAITSIVLRDGAPIGALVFIEEEDYFFLSQILLEPKFQGRGIGGHLIGEYIELAKAKKKPLRLQVLKKNERAKALYLRLGFEVSGETPTHYKMQCFKRNLE